MSQTTALWNDQPSDIDLWNAFTGGDQEAFGLIFRRCYPLLFQYGRKICSNNEVLEDTIQELFADLWQKKKQEPVQSVRAYLLKALKFKLYKQYQRKTWVNSLDDLSSEPFGLSHETFMIQEQQDCEKLTLVLETLNILPPRQKEIIYLKIYKGLSYEEISYLMQINYSVARNLLSQALKSLRKLGSVNQP